MILTPYRTTVFREGQDLMAFIQRHVPQLAEKDILVISSKLISLWKKCSVENLGKSHKEQLIKKESDAALKTKWAWLTIKQAMIMTNAGIDESNANGKCLLLPNDLYDCALEIRKAIQQIYGIKKVGVIITDSMILPLRRGVIGAACAYAGFCGVKDERGKKDLFGRAMQVTQVDLADALAAAASSLMGECAQRTPLCRIEQAPVQFVAKTDPTEIQYPLEEDLYAPLLKAVGLTKRRKK